MMYPKQKEPSKNTVILEVTVIFVKHGHVQQTTSIVREIALFTRNTVLI